MNNINISLGIELDKKQANDKHIQGEVDKVSSGVSIKVNKVEIGDVSKTVQNDLNKQVGSLNVNIKGVKVDESELQKTVDNLLGTIQDTLDKIPEEQRIKLIAEGGIFDLKSIKNQLMNEVKGAMIDSMKSTELDFGKLSVTGVKDIVYKIVKELESQKIDLNVEDSLKSVVDEFNKLSADIDLFGKEGTGSYNELEDRINRITNKIGELTDLNIDIDFAQIERLYEEVGKLQTKLFDFRNMDLGFTFFGVGEEVKDVIDEVNKLSKAISEIGKVDGGFTSDNITEYQKEINSLRKVLKSFSEEEYFNLVEADINDALRKLKEMYKELSRQKELVGKESIGEDLKPIISDVAIINEEQIKETLQQTLQSISKSLTLLVDRLGLDADNANLINNTNAELSKISEKLKPLDVMLAISDKVELSELQRKLDEISNKLSLKIKDIELGYSEFQQNDIQVQLNAFSEDTTLQISKIKLLNIVEEIQSKLNDIGKDLEITVKSVKVDDGKSKVAGGSKQVNLFDNESEVLSYKEAQAMINKANKEYEENIKLLLEGFTKNPLVDRMKGKLEEAVKSNTFGSDEVLSELIEKATKKIDRDAREEGRKYKEDILLGYEEIRKQLKGVTFKEESLIQLLDKDELEDFKKAIRGIAEIKKGAGIAIDSYMQEFRDIAKLNFLDLDGDVIQDNINRLSDYLTEMKGFKQQKFSFGLTDEEEEIYLAKLVEDYYAVADSIKNLKAIRDNDVASIERQLKETEALLEQQKQVNNVANGMSEVAKATDNATTELKEYNSELDKLAKESSTRIDGNIKSHSITTENLGQSKTVTTKFDEDGVAITEIEKLTDNVKAFEKEVDNVRNKIKLLTDTDTDIEVIAKLRNELDKFEIGDSIDDFNKFKREVDDLIESASSIDRIDRNLSDLGRSLDKAAANKLDIIDSDEAVKELNKVVISMRELESLKGKINDGEDVGITKINKAYTKADNAIKDYKDALVKVQAEYKANNKLAEDLSKAINDVRSNIDKSVADNVKFIDSDKAISELNLLMSKFNELYALQERIANREIIDKKVVDNAINDVKEIANTYTKTLSNISSNTKIFDDISKKLETSLTDKAVLGLDDSYVRGLIEELNKIDLSSNEAKESLNELNNTVKNLGKSDKDIQRIKGVINQLEDSISRIKDRKNLGIVTESDLRKMEEMKTHVTNLNGVIDKLNNGIDVTQIEIKDLETIARNSMRNISAVAESTRDSFASLGISLNRAMEFAIGDSIGDMISSQFRMAKDTILEIDNSLRDLRRVTDLSEEGYDNFTKSANETAMALGRTTAETINATTEFVKLGYSVEQAEGFLSKAGLTLANVADMETGDAIATITSTLKGFGIEAEQVTRVVDVMNEAGNRYALNSSDLAEMLRIASASMSIAGNDLEQTSALMIGAFEILRDSSKVANGLRTISMRLRGVAEEGEELNPKLGELIKTLTGVDLTDANGEFRNTYDILTEIGEQFDGLNSKEQALLLEEIAGKNQVIKASYVEKSA